MSDTCRPYHDWFTAVITFGLCCGLILSYAPQHLRIINSKSSEGFSPWFLLLGSTSSASGMLNMVAMQWGILKCCRVLSVGSCIEITAGVIQVGLQWFLFTFIFVLFMIYYPPHLKYTETYSDTDDTRPPHYVKTPVKSYEWRLSITLSCIVALHILLISFTTFFLLLTSTPSPSPTSPLPHQVSAWATFLGVKSAALAAIQYAPQLVHTYRLKLVGALSIPMMLIQSPGAVLMVLSIALRPGTNWTSWITFAVAGMMQGSLLIMCLCWKFRQRRLGIDDFGHPLDPRLEIAAGGLSSSDNNSVPVLVGEEDPVSLEPAIDNYVRSEGVQEVEETVGEEMPLLGSGKDKIRDRNVGWLSWFKRS